MKKFYLIVHGTNLRMRDEKGALRRFGFFQNHWLEAACVSEAAVAAERDVREDPKWEELLAEEGLQQLRIGIHEWIEVESFDDVGANPSGYSFYAVPRWWEVWKRDWWSTCKERW